MRSIDTAPLTDSEREAIREAAEALRARFPVEEIVLFGSKARGDSRPDSDTDVLILTARPMTWQERREVVDILFAVGLDRDVMFSRLVVDGRDWREGMISVMSIHDEIEREGVPV